MDVMIARQLLRNAIAAAGLLKKDRALVKVWQDMLKKMPDYQLAADGTLKEWLWPGLEENYKHRHVSHLYALYDGVDPDFKHNPELMQAARRVVEEHMKHRRKENGGEMVFGLAQMAFVTAHLEDAATTAEIIHWLSRFYWTHGMATYHNPGSLFNIDLSGGFPAVIMRALVYSEPGLIKLLPALPADWQAGSMKGMLLRNQIVLKELKWNGKRLELVLQSAIAQQLQLQLPAPIAKAVLGKDSLIQPSRDASGRLSLKLPAARELVLKIDLK